MISSKGIYLHVCFSLIFLRFRDAPERERKKKGLYGDKDCMRCPGPCNSLLDRPLINLMNMVGLEPMSL